MPSILIIDGRSRGYYFTLGRRNAVAGRDQTCDVQIMDELVSRRHAQLRYDELHDRFFVVDLQSANGIYVNDRRVESIAVLRDGDILTLGGTKLVYATREFLDSQAAFSHFKHRGQEGKSTLIPRLMQPPKRRREPSTAA